jgi:hypothetical protein
LAYSIAPATAGGYTVTSNASFPGREDMLFLHHFYAVAIVELHDPVREIFPLEGIHHGATGKAKKSKAQNRNSTEPDFSHKEFHAAKYTKGAILCHDF